MKLTLLCLALFAPPVFCIVGGKDVTANENTRFIVSIQSDSQRPRHYCAGVFITSKYVLTAASCVKNREMTDIRIKAGVATLSSTLRISLPIVNIFSKDPSGQGIVQNNIAILCLDDRFLQPSERKKIGSVRFAPHDKSHVAVGTECQTFGWGKTRREDYSDILQVGTSDIANLTECKMFNEDVTESNICTTSGKVTLCDFDVGDPLISESGYLLAIATEHYPCIGLNFYNIYTKVGPHEGWIWETIIANDNHSSSHKPQAIITGTLLIVWFSF